MHVPTSVFRRETRPVVLRDENVRACFYDVTTRMLCFLVLERQSVFLWCYHVNPLFLSCKTVEHRSRKSRDLLQTDEFMVTHLCLSSAHGSGWVLSFFWKLI